MVLEFHGYARSLSREYVRVSERKFQRNNNERSALLYQKKSINEKPKKKAIMDEE